MPTRSVTASLLTALSADELEVFYSIDLLFDSGNLYFWTGLGTKTIDGKDYIGAGNLLEISVVEETVEMSAKGMEITLSGISSSIISLALQEPFQGRVCNVNFGVTSDTTAQTEVFSGYVDTMNIQEGGDTCIIQLTVESKLIDLERPNSTRYTSAWLKNKYPGDKGLDFLEDLQDKRINWGQKDQNTSNPQS